MRDTSRVNVAEHVQFDALSFIKYIKTQEHWQAVSTTGHRAPEYLPPLLRGVFTGKQTLCDIQNV
jgi:hypothetical protein